MLELIFQGFTEWLYGMVLEAWQFFTSALLDIMSLDFAYLRAHIPVLDDIMQVVLAVGWALLIGNLVFQAVKSMVSGLGFEGEDPKLLFTRTFVFSFLLLASPQICRIGLNMTSTIIKLLEIPDAVNVQLVDKHIFGDLGVAWLLVIIFDVVLMFKVLKLLVEIAERYVILAMLTITAPLAFATGGSRNTSDIFAGWCRMFASMCLLMCTNIIFFKMLLSVASTVPSGLDVFAWFVLILAIVKVAKKADAIITRIGLNPAITGDSLGSRLPGMLAYTVIRTAAASVTKSIGKSGSTTTKGNSAGHPPIGGGPKYGGPPGGAPNVTGAKASAAPGKNSSGASVASASNTAHTQQESTQQNTQNDSTTINGGSGQLHEQRSARSADNIARSGSPQQNHNTPLGTRQARRSAVPVGIKRGASFVGAGKSRNPGGKDSVEQSIRATGKQMSASTGTQGKDIKSGDATRFSRASAQKAPSVGIGKADRVTEQRDAPGEKGTTASSIKPGNAETTASFRSVTEHSDSRSSQRSRTTYAATASVQSAARQPGTAGTPVSVPPAKQNTQPEARHGRNAASDPAVASVVRTASTPAPQVQRPIPSEPTAGPKQARSNPVPQESRIASTASGRNDRSTTSTRRTGTAGTGKKVSSAAQHERPLPHRTAHSPAAMPTADQRSGAKPTAATAKAIKQPTRKTASKQKGGDGHV